MGAVLDVLYMSVSVAAAGTTVLRDTGSESTANDVSAHAFMLAAVDSPHGQSE